MRMTQLDVVNSCLAIMGESKINSINEDHPLVASAVQLLREANARRQASGWWFNTEYVRMSPDEATGHIQVPSDFLAVDPEHSTEYAVRGRRLYSLHGGGETFTSQVDVRLIRLVPFEDLPFSAQDLISFDTRLEFSASFDADAQRVQQIMNSRAEAYRLCRTEHIRFVKANILSDGGIGLRRGRIRVTGGRMRGLRR